MPRTTKTSKSRKSKSKSKVRIPVTTRGGLFGYHIDLPEKKRRSLLKFLLDRKRATYSEIIKRLNVLSIYNKRRHPETSRRAKRDMDFVHKHYQKYSLTFKHTGSKRKSYKKKSPRRSKRKSPRRSKRKSSPRRSKRKSYKKRSPKRK